MNALKYLLKLAMNISMALLALPLVLLGIFIVICSFIVIGAGILVWMFIFLCPELMIGILLGIIALLIWFAIIL